VRGIFVQVAIFVHGELRSVRLLLVLNYRREQAAVADAVLARIGEAPRPYDEAGNML
jgi:hypothetical protein